jgi:hypothetical protein
MYHCFSGALSDVDLLQLIRWYTRYIQICLGFPCCIFLFSLFRISHYEILHIFVQVLQNVLTLYPRFELVWLRDMINGCNVTFELKEALFFNTRQHAATVS